MSTILGKVIAFETSDRLTEVHIQSEDSKVTIVKMFSEHTNGHKFAKGDQVYIEHENQVFQLIEINGRVSYSLPAKANN